MKFIFHASLLTMPVDFSITCLAFLSPSNNVRVTKRGNYGAQTRNLQRCHQCVALSKHTTSCEFYSNVCRQLLIQYTLIKETGITQKSHCCCLSKITTIKYTNETELNFIWEMIFFVRNLLFSSKLSKSPDIKKSPVTLTHSNLLQDLSNILCTSVTSLLLVDLITGCRITWMNSHLTTQAAGFICPRP